MQFNDVMHIAFHTDRMDEMIDFYHNKLGGKIQVLTRYAVYAGREDRPAQAKIAAEDPNRIFNVYIELAPGQYIELFPRQEGQLDRDDAPWGGRLGYFHYALTCDDIFATREAFIAAGITPDTDISKGPSETYQFWVSDPDGNKFEVMQYTDKSYQVLGHVDEEIA